MLWLVVGLAAALAPPATAPVAALRTDAATALDSCARAAALLSYKYAEEALRVAAAGTPCAGLETRGVLEARLSPGQRDHVAPLPLVSHFLVALGAAAAGADGAPGSSLAAGLALARRLADAPAAVASAAPFVAPAAPSRAPRRSLVGAVAGGRDDGRGPYDVALLRDRADGGRRFSVLLSRDRAKGRKAARVLAEVEGGCLYVRGVEVAEGSRGSGLAKVALATVVALADKLRLEPRARVMTKPVVARSLAALGFTADDERWPAWIAPSSDGKSTLVCPRDPADKRPYFSHAVIAAQRLAPVSARPPGAREVFLRSAYRLGDDRAACDAAAEPAFYGARLLAFAATVDALRPPLLGDCGAILGGGRLGSLI